MNQKKRMDRPLCLMEGVVVMGTAIVLIILLIVVSLVIRSIIKDKKNGKSITCGGDYCKETGLCRSFCRCLVPGEDGRSS